MSHKNFNKNKDMQQSSNKFGNQGAVKNEPKWNEKSGKNNNMNNSGDQVNKDGEFKKPGGRSRLFIGNLSEDTSEELLKKTFGEFGNIIELYVNGKRGFAFIKYETKQAADSAKDAFDGKRFNNRIVRVRYAAHGAALKIKNLSSHVSNETLEQAFSTFGPIDRCVHIVDDRGRPIGEGIVEFSKKMSAQIALKKCTEGCFLLGSYPKPIIVESFEQNDDEDGLQEKNVVKNQKCIRDREKGPRFVPRGTFEYDYAMRWKEQYEMEKQRRESLEREFSENRAKLEDQMEFALYEQETNRLREQLRMREEEANQLMRDRRNDGGPRPDDMFHNSGPDNQMMMNRNGNKMGGMNMRINDRGMSGPMDSNMGHMSGNSGPMQNMPTPLVGAPLPPADLLNVGMPQSRQSRFDSPNFRGESGPIDSGNAPGRNNGNAPGRNNMNRNDSRGPPMGGVMQGMGNQSFKRGPGGMIDPWDQEKRRRF